MSAFTISASAARVAAPMKMGGLGFRKAVAAVRVPVQPKAPVRAVALSAMVTVAGKSPGGQKKAKTRKSAAKRFKITASGKVLHRRPGKQHLNGHKTTERKNRLGKERRIGKAQLPLIKGCLPYSKKYLK